MEDSSQQPGDQAFATSPQATSFGETTGETLDPNLFSSSSPRLQLPDQEPQAPNSMTSQDTGDFHRSVGRERALLEYSLDTTCCKPLPVFTLGPLGLEICHIHHIPPVH